MTKISRRKLLATGLAAAAGGSALAVAARLAQKYGLIAPDHGGLYGPGETLTYASLRLLTKHSLAREFSRNQISKRPLPNEVGPFSDEFNRHQAEGFVNWRLAVDGMVEKPTTRSRNWSAKRGGHTSPSGTAFLFLTFWISLALTRKPNTWFITRSSPIGGKVWTSPMRCTRKPLSLMG